MYDQPPARLGRVYAMTIGGGVRAMDDAKLPLAGGGQGVVQLHAVADQTC
jgi:hypothetical protein